MSYFIIPPEQYFDDTAANLATPERFNAIFNIINQEAVSRHGFIYPIMLNVSHPTISLDSEGVPSPLVISFQEVGSALAPVDGEGATLYNITYEWSLATDSVGGFTGATGDSSVSIDLQGSTYDSATDTVGVDLTLTYLNINQSEYKVFSTSYSVPFVEKGLDGEAAITTPMPLIYAPFNHQPLSWLEPNSDQNAMAKILAFNQSFVPPGWGAYNVTWSLVDSGGNDYSNYISSFDNTKVELQIPDADKHFILTLTITNNGGINEYSTTVDIFTYGPGVFFLQWGSSDDIPQNPHFVSLEGITIPHSDSLFPIESGSMKVKWGYDNTDFGEVGIANYSGYLGGPNSPNSEALSTAFTAAGLTPPTSEDEWNSYALINIEQAANNIVDNLATWFIFIGGQGMVQQAKIEADVSSSNAYFSAIIPEFVKSHTYLISGLAVGQAPNGFFDQNVSIGSKFERSIIHLKHYEVGNAGNLTYVGNHDQTRIVTPSKSIFPISTIFKGVPNNIYFHASVASAIGSSYSGLMTSYGGLVPSTANSGIISLTSARTISGVVVAGEQFGVDVDITLNSGSENPIGYLVSYREFGAADIIDESLVPSFSANSADYSVLFIKSRHFSLPAKLGRKVKVWVKSVMGDGSMSVYVASSEVVVQFPSSFEQSLLRVHLGRSNGTTPASSGDWENTWEDEGATYDFSQHTTHFATFAKKTELQGVNVWVQGLESSSSQWDIIISIGGSGASEHYDVATNIDSSSPGFFSNTTPTLYYLDDLSVTKEAGTPIGINLRFNGATGTEIGDLGDKDYDITVELTYSYPFEETA